MKSKHITIYLDPERLRNNRLRRQWTQKDLAQASGFSEEYISKLERSSSTRNKGTRIVTIAALARALKIPLALLLTPDTLSALQYDIPRNEVEEDSSILDAYEVAQGQISLRLMTVGRSYHDANAQISGKKESLASQHRLSPSIDPGLLQAHRLRKRWTQKDLAQASGFSEDYISQLERSATTKNKGTKLETAVRIAQALEIPIDALFTLHLLNNEDLTALTQFFRNDQQLFWRIVPTTYFAKDPVKIITELLENEKIVYTIQSQGLWLDAERKALEARSLCSVGSEEWAEITLRHCTYLRQQSGDILGAERHMQDIQQSYLNLVEHPHPRILGQLHTCQGWLDVEQFGNFQRAHTKCTAAIPEAREAGDRETELTARHFRFRALLDIAMEEGGAQLGLRPIRSLATQRIRTLYQSLEEDLLVAQQSTPDDPNHVYYRCMMYALVQPQKAIHEFPILADLASQKDMERWSKLLSARWQVSNQAWDVAIAFAKEAFQGFQKAQFPYGTALSSAIWATSLFHEGIRTKNACTTCLDLWILALLLHPYHSHPIFTIARLGLLQAVKWIERFFPQWIRDYENNIQARITEQEGVFSALDYAVTRETTVILTTLQLIRH